MQDLIELIGQENATQNKKIHFSDTWQEKRGLYALCADCNSGARCSNSCDEIINAYNDEWVPCSLAMLEKHPTAMQALVYLVQQKKIAEPGISQAALAAYAWEQYLPGMGVSTEITAQSSEDYLRARERDMTARAFDTAVQEAISKQKGEEKEAEATHCYTMTDYLRDSNWDESRCVNFAAVWRDIEYAYFIDYFDGNQGSRKAVQLNPAQTARLSSSRMPSIENGLREGTPLPIPSVSNIILSYVGLLGYTGQSGHIRWEMEEIEEGTQFSNPFQIVMDPSQQAILAGIFSEVFKAQQEATAARVVGILGQLCMQVENAAAAMEKNPLYKASSNKLRVVRILHTALEKLALESGNALRDKGAVAFLQEYRVQLGRSMALASILLSYDTKGSRMAQFGSLFGKAGEATEIAAFAQWLATAKKKAISAGVGSAREFDAIFADLKQMLSQSIEEIGVLDAQKPFKSLLEKLDQPDMEGEAMLRGLIATGSVQRAQGLGYAQAIAFSQEELRGGAAAVH